jgi:hypothetical protein
VGPEARVRLTAWYACVCAQDFAVQIAADNLGELKQEEIVLLLKKAMGANYDRQTSAY